MMSEPFEEVNSLKDYNWNKEDRDTVDPAFEVEEVLSARPGTYDKKTFLDYHIGRYTVESGYNQFFIKDKEETGRLYFEMTEKKVAFYLDEVAAQQLEEDGSMEEFLEYFLIEGSENADLAMFM